MKHLAILILLASCGVKVTTDVPNKVAFGPDFEAAALFCDNKYGAHTIESEECFQDYRTFLSPKISIDLASIESFCKAGYATPEEVAGCQQDLLGIIKGSAPVKY